MIECNEFQRWLVDYVYGELDPRKENLLTDHVRTCPACRSELAALEKTRTMLNAWPAPAAEPSWAFPAHTLSWWSVLKTAWGHKPHQGQHLAFGLAFVGMMFLTAMAVFNTRLQYENGRWQFSMSLSKPAAVELPADAVIMTRRQLYEFEVKHLQFMQSLVAQSEGRQQQTLNRAMTNLAQDVDRKRLHDLKAVSAGLEALQDHTATRLAMTDRVLTEFIEANYNDYIQ